MAYKICHITTVHDSDDIRIFHKECVSLAKEPDFDVYLIAPGQSRKESNVHVVGIGDRPSSRLKRAIYFSKKAYKMAIGLDCNLYHFHDPELFRVAVKLKKAGKYVVFDSHEDTRKQIELKTYIPSIIRSTVARIYSLLQNKIIKVIDGVVFPTLVDGKTPFDTIAKRLIIVDNLPILAEFKDVCLSPHPVYDIVCTGSLTSDRGIKEMLNAARQTNSTVCLAGKFSPPEFKCELEKNGLLDKNVDFRGYCGRDDIIDILRHSRIVLSNIHDVGQYSHIENLPTKVYEAMAIGLPVVISNFSYTVALNDEINFAITVEPDNVAQIVEAVKYLKRDNEARRRLGKNGRRYIESKCNWELEVKKIVNMYHDILEDKND